MYYAIETLKGYSNIDTNDFTRDEYRILVKFYNYGFYYSKLCFYKFKLIKHLIETNSEKIKKEEDGLLVLDLTKEFIKYVDLNNLDFYYFQYVFHIILLNKVFDLKTNKERIAPLSKFLDFLGYEISI
jgi:hypothetical protein